MNHKINPKRIWYGLHVEVERTSCPKPTDAEVKKAIATYGRIPGKINDKTVHVIIIQNGEHNCIAFPEDGLDTVGSCPSCGHSVRCPAYLITMFGGGVKYLFDFLSEPDVATAFQINMAPGMSSFYRYQKFPECSDTSELKLETSSDNLK